MRRFAILILVVVGVLAAVPAVAAAARIALVRNDDIWSVRPDGGGARRLTSGSASDRVPAWSPDRKTIIFVRSSADPLHSEIRTVSASGGSSHLLSFEDSLGSTDSYRFTTGLAYSPDGKTLAVSDAYTIKGSPYTHNCVLLVDLATRTSSVLVKRASGLDTGWRLSWSPNGRTILLGEIGQSDEGARGWRLNVATGKLTSLGIRNACKADWSPDGRHMVVCTCTQTSTSILLATARGKVIRKLASGVGWFSSGSGRVFSGACFSPSGSQIVFNVSDQPSGKRSIWVMKSDGRGKHRLAAGEQPIWK